MDTVTIIFFAVLVVLLIFLGTALFGAPYVPTREKEVKEAFRKLKPLSKKDVVVDFGAGDGVILRAAARSGAGRAVGLELNPILVLITRFRYRREKRIEVRCGNMTMMKLPEDMTVAYVFGLDRVMKMLKPVLERFAREQGRSVYVISNAFEFAGVKAKKKYGAFYLYEIGP